jgi:hypothetical protein
LGVVEKAPNCRDSKVPFAAARRGPETEESFLFWNHFFHTSLDATKNSTGSFEGASVERAPSENAGE